MSQPEYSSQLKSVPAPGLYYLDMLLLALGGGGNRGSSTAQPSICPVSS